MARPPIGEKPMTNTDYVRRYRQRKRGLIPNEREQSDKEKLATLRAENRQLLETLRLQDDELNNRAQAIFNQEVEIKLLRTKLAKKEETP